MRISYRRIFAYGLMLCIIFASLQLPVSAEVYSPAALVQESAIEKAEPQDIEEAINLTLRYYGRLEYINADWDSVSINAAGGEVESYGISGVSYLTQLKNRLKQSDTLKYMTDYERISLGILSAGGEPTNFEGINFIDRIAKWPDLGQGINAGVWGLIAFDAANAVIPEGAVHTRESLIDYILHTKSGEGWSYGGSEPDPDMTGMALYALAPYRDRLDVKRAGEAAIEWLSRNQKSTGGYASWGTLNSESISQVILGITAWGIDPQGEAFTKTGGNAVTALLKYQIKTGPDEGMFYHEIAPNAGPDAVFATPQGLQALSALRQYYDEGISTVFYNIRANGASSEEITGITLSPNGLELEKGIAFEMGLKNQKNFFISNDKAQWSVNDNEIAVIDDSGVLTARKTGTVTVNAVLKADTGIRASMQVKVVEAPFEIEDITGASQDSVKKGIKLKLTNKSSKGQSALCIAGLYEKGTERLDRLHYMEKAFKAGESHIFEAEFVVEEAYRDDYEIRILVWENWSKARPLAPAFVR